MSDDRLFEIDAETVVRLILADGVNDQDIMGFLHHATPGDEDDLIADR